MNIKIPKLQNNLSRFDLSHTKSLSCDMAALVPTLLLEIVPGDTMRVKSEALIRLSPLVAPIMHEVNVFFHYFFVPNRLSWTNWESFITGGEEGTDASTPPTINFTTAARGQLNEGDLGDYMGLPVDVDISVSALPFRAYARVYNEWYRDQNIQTSPLVIPITDGVDSTVNIALQFRNWEKDYFTSCLPWPQKGTAVSLPLGTSAPLSGTGIITRKANGSYWDVYDTSTSNKAGTSEDITIDASEAGKLVTGGTGASLDPRGQLELDYSLAGTADLSTATAATINEFRNALSIQRWLERNARAGSRYAEHVLAHFGVRTSDARLQRPEYLGGGKSPVLINEVVQTSETNTTAQGNLAGYGLSAQSSKTFTKSFNEHGYLIGIMSIMPRSMYQEGVPKHWSRSTKYDYLFPEFWNIGEQAVLNKEVYAGAASPDATFGYQSRYEEYRHIPSSVHGEMKDTSGLANWHMGRIFGAEPSLNSAFVKCTPTTRVFENTTDDTCQVQLANIVHALRPLPKYAEPSI